MVEIAKRLVFYDIPHIVACWISIQARAGYPATWLPEFLDFAKTGVFAHFWCFWAILVFLGYFGIFWHFPSSGRLGLPMNRVERGEIPEQNPNSHPERPIIPAAPAQVLIRQELTIFRAFGCTASGLWYTFGTEIPCPQGNSYKIRSDS